jgi:nanoRNase/pAp phosphatase (c-di-AMP/oligoRNAs hydrolase)
MKLHEKTSGDSPGTESGSDPLEPLWDRHQEGGVSRWDPEGKADRFLKILPDSGNILLTSHDNPDPDALASCMALQRLLAKKKGVKPYIAIGGILGRAENRAMSLELDLDLLPWEILEDKHWNAVVMVDAQPRSGNTNLPRGLPVTAIIDHHPKRKAYRIPFVDIRPQYGAVSSILVEYLIAQGMDWDSKLATALFYAIKSETADLGRGICDADRKAFFALFDSVDWELMHRIVKAKIPADYFQLFPRGIELAKVYGDALICDLEEIPVPDAVAEIADFMLRHEAVSRSLILGQYESQLVFSIRFTPGDLDAGVIAASIVKGYGSGGGHDQMAGGRIYLNRAGRHRAPVIKRTIINRFLKAVGADRFKPGRPLMETT